MITNHVRECLIYTPFKNCSSSLHNYFRKRPPFNSTLGPHPAYNDGRHERSGKHTAWLSPEWSDWKKFLPLRNPFDRVRSMYWWHISKHEELEFDEWFDIHMKQPVCEPVIKIYFAYDHIIRCEHIEDDLREHGLLLETPKGAEIPFPRNNVTNPPRRIEFTQRQRDIIYWFHIEDFVAGNYPRDEQ